MSMHSVMIDEMNERFDEYKDEIRNILNSDIITSIGADRLAVIAMKMSRNRKEVDRLTELAGGTVL